MIVRWYAKYRQLHLSQELLLALEQPTHLAIECVDYGYILYACDAGGFKGLKASKIIYPTGAMAWIALSKDTVATLGFVDGRYTARVEDEAIVVECSST